MIKIIVFFSLLLLVGCSSNENIINTPKDREIEIKDFFSSGFDPIIIKSYTFSEYKKENEICPCVNAYVFQTEKDTVVIYDKNVGDINIYFKNIKPWIKLKKQKYFSKCVVNELSKETKKLESYKFIYASITFVIDD